MAPHLSTRGLWVFVGALIFIGAGAFAERPVLLLMGEVMVGVLAISFLLCVVAALALDRRFVSIVCADAEDDKLRHISTAVRGEEKQLHIVIRNDAWIPLYGLQLKPYASEFLAFEDIPEHFHIPSGVRSALTIAVRAKRSGRWCLHGFDIYAADPLGLLITRDYLPCTHAMEVYPRSVQALGVGFKDTGTLARRHGTQRSRQRGGGSNVRELREYHPGDPLRNIAWKATARAGKLISRDYERDVDFSVYLLLDISTSMRGGQWQGQKLEHGIELVTEVAEKLCRARDRVGLMTFDEKLYGHIAPGASMLHLGHMLRHLVGVGAIVDPDFCEWSDTELVTRLADYLMIQERLDFRRTEPVDPDTGVNRDLLERWVRGTLPGDMARYDSGALRDGVVVNPPSALRQFAQLRGLAIPYRIEARLGLKERGLQESIEKVVTSTRSSQLIVVVTDLCGITSIDLLTRAIRLAKLKGHTLHFLVPFTPAYHDEVNGDEASKATERYHIARELFAIPEREERLRIAGNLRELNVRVDFLKPGQTAMQFLGL
ncbi:DUF58 domain-containing protein [Bradymonas sediminis]|uniref:DUF58 domain-containing protein n=1 Tax=Bradymonas sediminis TaxID=1548548 RepID=UPI00105FA37B|nr:DUF58 domain-containing protein [Bradymonas sediminis]TDP76042.1 uncharacterized protein (DUF58 family) [Bradymonas sediminis]